MLRKLTNGLCWKLGLSALREKAGFLASVRPRLRGDITEGDAGCEDFFNSLLAKHEGCLSACL